MSSYLNIYLKDKESKKNLLLKSYSRNNPLYQAFYENLNMAYAGSETEKFTTLTLVDVNKVLESLQEDEKKVQKRLVEVEKYAAGNAELIDEILSLKELLEETSYTICHVQFLSDILEDCISECNSFEAMLVNTD